MRWTDIVTTGRLRIYHGPTSIFDGELSNSTGSTSSPLFHPASHRIPLNIASSAINQSLALFFRWQYPQFMFIPREAFLEDQAKEQHLQHSTAQALLYSACSIGALMSPEINIRNLSSRFANSAHSILMAPGLALPHVTSLQALLCLAFYEIGQGSFSKGWQYSGMAFRMGQDLGFQRDPTKITSNENSLDLEYGHELQRRVYWGCYISDK